MFMITALAPIRIDSFWCNFASGTVEEVEIWVRQGTFVGFQNSSAGWTMLDSVTNLVSAGAGSFTKVPIFVDFEIQTGCQYSFYVTRASLNNTNPYMQYTNGPFGSTAGALYTSNAHMQVSYAYGKDYPFGATFNPRIWNGRIHYTCVPASLPSATYTNIPTASCSGDTVEYSFIPGSGMAPGVVTMLIHVSRSRSTLRLQMPVRIPRYVLQRISSMGMRLRGFGRSWEEVAPSSILRYTTRRSADLPPA